MPSIDFIVESKINRTGRVKQLSALFDVPPTDVSRLEWHGDMPIEAEPWQIGLIVGPSGSGKTSILKRVFGEPADFTWSIHNAVIDDFGAQYSIAEIGDICQAVGFNTIPAWMRPFNVLSNGEQFRARMARALLESASPIVVDEFTSVVDRQVAQIGAHAIQKYIRRTDKKFVAASCHYDVIDWLQPDWIFEPATMKLARGSLQRRPPIDVEIRRVRYDTWRLFAPYHYLTANLNKVARCFALFVNGRPASFAGVMHRPHPRVNDIQGCSRLVTLPDWQGLGLAMVLIDKLGAAYKSVGKRLHTYPAHPALIRTFDRSPAWRLEKKPGLSSVGGTRRRAKTGVVARVASASVFGDRPCAVFEYTGAAMNVADAKALLEW